MFKEILLVSVLGWSSIGWSDCPARRGEESPTFSQVMYHFGRATRVAGFLAIKGQSDPQAITKDQLSELENLARIAAHCASLAASPKADTGLWPRRSQSLTGRELKIYLDRHRRLLVRFQSLLLQIEEHSCEMRLRDWLPEDFTRLKTLERDLLNLANYAHREMG